jgi:sugar (pentulose or hexulose) kinase
MSRLVAMAMAGGSDNTLWREILAGVTGLEGRRRSSGLAAAAGGALIGSDALGLGLELDVMDPPLSAEEPDPDLVELYSRLAPTFGAALRATVDFADLSIGDEAGYLR